MVDSGDQISTTNRLFSFGTMQSFSSLVLPTNTLLAGLGSRLSERRVLATSAEKNYDFNYFLKGALAGGICCSITHGGLTPVDVVKTRIQLDPVTFNKGLIGGFKQIIEAEGMGGLLTGLGPTVVGYFIQGEFNLGFLDNPGPTTGRLPVFVGTPKNPALDAS
jgi:hypothetical protein